MKFTDTHEWIDIDDTKKTAKIGISTHAQSELGDIVYVELPKIGKEVKKGDPVAVLESTKAAADVYAPISGTILNVNTTLSSQPELINNAPEKEGWLFTITVKDAAEADNLIDSQTYHSKFS